MKQRYTPRLRHERERRGWSRNYIAERIEVDMVTVGRWERGERLPHPLYRQQLCDLFEMSAEDLGLLSEPQEPEEVTPTANASLEISHTTNGVAERSSEPLVPSALTIVTSPARQMLLTEEKMTPASSLQFQRRRALLIGLGGLGVAAITGASFFFTSHTSSLSTSPTIPPSKPSQQLLDASSYNWVNRLTWPPSGNEIAAATGANIVSIWDMQKAALIYNIPTLDQWVNDISWSKTGWIVSANAGSLHSGSIQAWKYPEVTPVVTLQRDYALRTVSWSPNGTYLAFAGHTTTVEVWNPFTLRQVSHYAYPALGLLGINRVKWSATGTLLACATDDGTVHVWEALTGKRKTIYHGHQLRAIDIAWSPDERYITSASADKTVQVWEALTGRTIQIYEGHTGEVEAVDWSLQGKYIASGGADYTLQVWEALTGKLVAKYTGIDSTIEAVLWSSDSTRIAIGTNKQGIEIWPAPR